MGTSLRPVVKLGAATVLAGLVCTGCLKKEEFPPEPVITFKSLEQFGDSASLSITFTDGDGDIGLDDGDTQAPFDAGSTFYHNLFLGYEEFQDGQWVEVELLLPLNYRIPRITPSGQNKALSGEIAVALKPWPIFPVTGDPDTLRFTVKLVDRSLNESNEVTSSEVVVE
ncbi:MAG: hypothetical protein IPN62_12430 [Flavobacteriales bacterium]|nr:hypothetical protein [Flavobacteriales bacterium]